jgi:hypothetical protein
VLDVSAGFEHPAKVGREFGAVERVAGAVLERRPGSRRSPVARRVQRA